MTRSVMIRRAASMPQGSPERRELLAKLGSPQFPSHAVVMVAKLDLQVARYFQALKNEPGRQKHKQVLSEATKALASAYMYLKQAEYTV